MRSLFGWLHRLSMILTVIGGYFTRAHNAAEEDESMDEAGEGDGDWVGFD